MLRTGNTKDGEVFILFDGKREDGVPFQIVVPMKPEYAEQIIMGLNQAIQNCKGLKREVFN